MQAEVPRFLFLKHLPFAREQTNKHTPKKRKKQQEGKQLYHLHTHSDTICMFVQVQTCWQHWTHITKMQTRLRNLVVIGSGLNFYKNYSRKIRETRMKLNRVGQNVAAKYHQWRFIRLLEPNVDIRQSELLPCQHDSSGIPAVHHDTAHQTRPYFMVELLRCSENNLWKWLFMWTEWRNDSGGGVVKKSQFIRTSAEEIVTD